MSGFDGDLIGAIASKPRASGGSVRESTTRPGRARRAGALPTWYGDRGYVDFQVVRDTLLTDDAAGKGVLSLTVEEGKAYQVGTFEIIGNRRFSLEQLAGDNFPFSTADKANSGQVIGVPFNRSDWAAATERVTNVYMNNGYIRANVEAEESRRVLADGTPVLDLRWRIFEGGPSTINKIEILGNDVTHERVIREAIVVLPGELFNRERLIRSYQNVNNLGFFEQPMPFFDVRETPSGDSTSCSRSGEADRPLNFGASGGRAPSWAVPRLESQPSARQSAAAIAFGRNIRTSRSATPTPRSRRVGSGTVRSTIRARFVIGLGTATPGAVSLSSASVLRIAYTPYSHTLPRIRYTKVADIHSRSSAPRVAIARGLSVARLLSGCVSGGRLHGVPASISRRALGGTATTRRSTFIRCMHARNTGASAISAAASIHPRTLASRGSSSQSGGSHGTLLARGYVWHPLRATTSSRSAQRFEPFASSRERGPSQAYAAFNVEAGPWVRSIYLPFLSRRHSTDVRRMTPPLFGRGVGAA